MNTYVSNGGRVACQDHVGNYASTEAKAGKARIITPLDIWELMNTATETLFRNEIGLPEGPVCESCRYSA